MNRRADSGQRTANWLLMHQAALNVICPEPGCNQAPGDECRNVHTGQPLNREPAHWRRIAASDNTTNRQEKNT